MNSKYPKKMILMRRKISVKYRNIYLRKDEIFCIFVSLIAGIAQLVERHLAKVNVAGSNPVSRSICAKVKK